MALNSWAICDGLTCCGQVLRRLSSGAAPGALTPDRHRRGAQHVPLVEHQIVVNRADERCGCESGSSHRCNRYGWPSARFEHVERDDLGVPLAHSLSVT